MAKGMNLQPHLVGELTRSRELFDSSEELVRPRKRVRISMQEPLVHHYEIPEQTKTIPSSEGNGTKRVTHRTWLTRQELGYFRSCAKRLCQSVFLDDVLQVAYHESGLQLKENVSPSEASEALASNEDYVAQRGLERWSSSRHSFVRSTKIVEVRSTVILEQTSQMLTGKPDPLRLAKASLEASRSSRQFARLLASADASLAQKVRQEQARAA